AAENAHITLSLVSKNPLTIKVKIQNTDIHPISMWKKYSPLSKEAFSLGLFKFSDTVPGITFGAAQILHEEGYRPRDASELAQINSCEALEEDIVLACTAEHGKPTHPDNLWYEMLKMGGDTIISMQGYWHGLWPASIEDVMKSDLGVACNGVWDNLGLAWSSFDHVHLNFDEEHHAEYHHPEDNHVEEQHVPYEEPPTPVEAPYTVTEVPHTITEKPHTITEKPHTATKRPHTVLHKPHIHIKNPHIIIKKPHTIKEKPHTIIKQGHNVTNSTSSPTKQMQKAFRV
ncbi:hypothetical protein IL306_005964, partial [Fusarium sp. DS 682]